jgi:hypothetical protein
LYVYDVAEADAASAIYIMADPSFVIRAESRLEFDANRLTLDTDAATVVMVLVVAVFGDTATGVIPVTP